MKAEYIQKGESLDYKNETEIPINAGDVVVFGTRIGISGTVIPSGRIGSIQMEGVFRFMKKEGEEIPAGTAVYFTEAGMTASQSAEAVSAENGSETGEVKTGEAVTAENEVMPITGDAALPMAGYAVSTAEAASKYVTVKLLG